MAKYIEQHIKNSLAELMKAKRLEDIKVKDLVEYADVNRKTFYNHFNGISGLIGDIFAGDFERIVNRHTDTDTWTIALHDIMEVLMKNSEFCNSVFHSCYRADAEKAIKSSVDSGMLTFVNSAVRKLEAETGTKYELSPHNKDFLVRYYTAVIYINIESWFAQGMQEPAEYVIKLVEKLNRDGLYEGIKFLAEK